MRGSFGSGGEFSPFDERPDGLATLRWIRAQPWHEGGVGTIGPSYLGLVQWAIADEVDAMAPSITASQFRDMAMGSGALGLDTAMSWLLLLDVQEARAAPLLMARGLRGLEDVWDHLPLGEIDERALGGPSPIWREWIEHMAPDSPYWDTRDFSSNVGDVEAPVQLVGGWQDMFLPWLVEDWHALRAKGRSPQLIIGPGAHVSPVLMSVGLREGIAWLRKHLLGDGRLVRDTPVRVWVGGERAWRDLEDWPPPGVARAQAPPPARRRARARRAPARRRRADALSLRPARPDAGGRRRRPARALAGARQPRARGARRRRDVHRRAAGRGPRGARPGPRRHPLPLLARADTDVFVRVCDVDAGRRVVERRDALLRLTPSEPPRGDDGTARVEFPLWPTATASRPATASACRSPAARTRATPATRAPARIR